MRDENIELKDYFKIDDSHSKIRGFVVIKDENGNVILKKENMIVKSGRKMIFDAITGGTGFNMTSLTPVFSEKSDLTTEVSTYSDGEYIPSGIKLLAANSDKNDLFITYTFRITADSGKSYKLRSMGLVYKDSSNNNNLFSRLVFDEIGLSPSRILTFNYYIYF